MHRPVPNRRVSFFRAQKYAIVSQHQADKAAATGVKVTMSITYAYMKLRRVPWCAIFKQVHVHTMWRTGRSPGAESMT